MSLPLPVMPPPLALTLALALSLAASSARAQPASGPGFDCRRAHAAVLKLVCDTPELAALDRQLNDVYDDVIHQAAIAAAPRASALREEEDRWRRERRDRCADVACLRLAYRDRIDALRDASLRASNPAAFADTRPFPVAEADSAAARAYIGRPCGRVPVEPPDGLQAAAAGDRPILQFRGVVVAPFRRGATTFAFLESVRDGGPEGCRIVDVVALPAPSADASPTRPRTFACTADDDAWSGLGVGPRPGALVALWRVDVEAGRLWREAVHVPGLARRCLEPEAPEADD